ncbi:hypothetical protein [Paludisphaera mucosa]|uniref:Uncharacterized protein n=1 Tax=Paludisphaera mucosa TaxID=3030827 RepID=A0ABT6F6L0_9BACT|nr:hypothetical protein [Paludisphaera mucosa]MDG3003218.1 hypothetical protein [Paludisphaera mucosa]
MASPEQAQARPLFRKLALGMAGVCLALGGIVVFAPVEAPTFTAGVCLFVGFVMLTIGLTGSWPAPRKR